MTIIEYLQQSGRTLSDLAAAAGLHHSYVSRLANGHRSNPTLKAASSLVKASEGRITYEGLGLAPEVPTGHDLAP